MKPIEQIEPNIGDHFWAELDGKLAVFLSTKDGFYICGGWECNFHRDKFKVLEIIRRPQSDNPLYYE